MPDYSHILAPVALHLDDSGDPNAHAAAARWMARNFLTGAQTDAGWECQLRGFANVFGIVWNMAASRSSSSAS